MTELMAPAGNYEKLRWAVAYGADSVYFGLEFGSLRNFADNFTLEDAEEGIRYLHTRGKKAYVTLNIYPFSDEYDRLIQTGCLLDDMQADGLIVSDLGLLAALKKKNLKATLHISTQANTTSWQSALAYKDLGASRVNLARELSLRQIKEIQQNLNGHIETEVFIHGALCFSYSGRCAISDYMTGFGANRGQCKHPCRYLYYLVEEKRPGKYMPVLEDNRGLYFFNSKDLALFEYIPALTEAGITAFKIEGRMKSIHYLAATISLYRRILDGQSISVQQALTWLNRVPNRGYTSGFIKGAFLPQDYSWDKSISAGTSRFVANVIESAAHSCTIRVRNTICSGQKLEVLQPGKNLFEITLPSPLQTTERKTVDFAQSESHLLLPIPLPDYTILRQVLQPAD